MKYAPLTEKIKPLKYGISRVNYEIIEIMKSLLKFNPFFRMTAYECIQSKSFDPVRDLQKEKILTFMQNENAQIYSQTASQAQGSKSSDAKTQGTSPDSDQVTASTFEAVSNNIINKGQLANKVMIELPIDSSDAFDYENPDNAKYSVNDLKYILHREVISIQKQCAKQEAQIKQKKPAK